LVENKVSCEVNIDSFHEIFRKTNVTTTTKTAEFKTISNGIGKSPTLIIPWLNSGEIFIYTNYFKHVVVVKSQYIIKLTLCVLFAILLIKIT